MQPHIPARPSGVYAAYEPQPLIIKQIQALLSGSSDLHFQQIPIIILLSWVKDQS